MPGFPHRASPASEAYRYLETVRRANFAWEWLRRDPDYRRLALDHSRQTAGGVTIAEAASPECEARWGCLHTQDPSLRSTDAPVLWSEAVDPSVLQVRATPAPAGHGPVFDLNCWASCAMVVSGRRGYESLLLRGADGGVRLDVMAGSLLNGPVTLRYDIAWSDDVDWKVATLRRFLYLCRTGNLPKPPIATNQRSKRLIRTLQVHDARDQGASIRDIGVMLFGMDRVQAEWPGSGDALKSQCRRLIALARFMASGGYRSLLR